MEKTKSARKMPQSLNDRHYRLLQDLSAPPKPSRLDYDGEEVEQKPTIVELESQLHLGKVSSTVNDHRGIHQLSDGEEVEKKPTIDELESQLHLGKVSSTVNDHSGIHQLSEQMKEVPSKVKIIGRRRLCKMSSRDDKIGVETDAPSFSGITDFDSPQPAQNENETEHIDGASEIRDILMDLSSRLEDLSIKKKQRSPKISGSVEDSFGVDMGPVANKENEVVSTGYGGSISSFLNMSDPFDSLGDATANAGSDVQKGSRDHEDKVILQNELRGDFFGKRVGQKIQTQGHHSVSKIEKDKDGDGHNYIKVGNLVRGEYGYKNYGKDQNKNVQKDMKMKFIATGKTMVPKVQEREDVDEDDCVVLSSDKAGIGRMKQGSKFREDNDNSGSFYKLGSAGEDFVLECENSVILKRPKSAFKLSSKIANILYPHQRDGLRWLWSLHCQGKGGILGDDMGLGKTMQICGFLAGLFHSQLIKKALVVAPKTLLPHWIKELSAVGLSEKTREYSGPNAKLREYELQYVLQNKGVLLTTYDIVRNNSKSLMGGCESDDEEMEDGATWDYMILDEGHLIKNPSTQRAKSLLEISCARRIIISGTPLQNNLKELWALFNFCCPDLLGDKKWFKENYENPILRGNDKKASDRDKRIGSAVAKELRERIKPYFLRRMKSEVFNEDSDQMTTKLSKKNDIIVWLRMTNCQRRLYEAFLKSELVLSAFDGSPLAALTILKKICDHPFLLTKRAAEDVLEGMDLILDPGDAGVAEKLAKYIADVADRDDYAEKHDNVSCKISFILSLLENLIPEGHNVLIFSQTRKMLNLIEDLLSTYGYKFLRIDGTTKASDRLRIVNEFQEGNVAPIFLLTSQVGGLGLTLTRADRVIVVDPAWNPSTDNQSVDRAYRIGQKKDVIVYRLMTCGTVEEKIYRKQIYKGGLFKTATEHKEQIRYFSQQDLRELFSLPKEGFDISVTQQQLHEEHDNMHTMDEFLKSHIEFLETLAIAGVSHHNLLFSKTAPVEVLEEDDHWIRPKTNDAVYREASSSSLLKDDVDWANNAFKPKDVNSNNRTTSPLSSSEVTEVEIQMKISRLSQTLANKALMSRLPDKGEKIERQISTLYSELHQLRMARMNEADLDEITGKLDRVVSL